MSWRKSRSGKGWRLVRFEKDLLSIFNVFSGTVIERPGDLGWITGRFMMSVLVSLLDGELPRFRLVTWTCVLVFLIDIVTNGAAKKWKSSRLKKSLLLNVHQRASSSSSILAIINQKR